MFISRKKIKQLEQRIADLEKKSVVNTYSFGQVDLAKLAKIFEQRCKPSTNRKQSGK